MTPIVTIVTPSYNQGPFIRATIESVLSQNYSHLEYIVMDGGSSDETASVVKDYASRLTWVSERDRGQSHAINKGFQAAKGEIVSWLNSDDTILPGAVAAAVRGFREEPEAGAVYGEGYRLAKNGEVTGRFPSTEPLNLWKLTHLSDYILQQSVYFRRSIFDEVGFLDEDLHYVMDWDILIRIGLHSLLHYVPDYMGCIREYPEAKSFSGGGRRIGEIKRVLRKHTGMRFPPGYLAYGLDTYRNIWCEWIEARTAPWLDAPSVKLRALVSKICGYWIERTIRHSQGLYPDGWAGPAVRLMLPPPRGRSIRMEGEIPQFVLGRSPAQELSISLNGLPPKVISLKSGPFDLGMEAPRECQSQALLLLLMRSSRYRAPEPHERNLGRRKVSFRLKSIRLSGSPKESATGRAEANLASF